MTRLGRPLPVEYLLQDIAVAFPKEQAFTFFAAEGVKPFPIEHREDLGEHQVTFSVFFFKSFNYLFISLILHLIASLLIIYVMTRCFKFETSFNVVVVAC